MTMGKDMSSLFADVVKNMNTTQLDLKKLIYLYIISNAQDKPEDAILIVSAFQADAKDPSPIVRALAVRTMGCINVRSISDYLCECVGTALKDDDPYVRKTAAVGVSKLFALNPEVVEEHGFIQDLRTLISDDNAMVVSNAVASLAEMSERTGTDLFQMNSNVLSKLLNAMTQCTEWGIVYILDCLAKYEPDPQEAQDVVERVSINLNHSNAAVVLSTVRVIVRYLDRLENPRLEQKLLKEKLPPPLISLVMNHKAEVQYVALTNINLIIQKATALQQLLDSDEKKQSPSRKSGLILSDQVQNFFCRYNDPTYLKMEKLDIMVKLVNFLNIDKVLMEFKTYCTEVDIDFVRKSVLAIGRCAIKLDEAAERCIMVLLELIEASSGQEAAKYIIQETVVVIQDIFRKYPERFEPIISKLCEYLDDLNEPEAKAAMIWIIGEYSGRIDNSPQLLEDFRVNFLDEPAQVQLQLLTAIVKLFLRRPEESRDMISQVFEQATNQEDNPDVRDRGYMYWRLCFMNVQVAANVVMSPKPVITDDDFNHSPEILDALLANLTTLASVYHKPPEYFIKNGKKTISFKKTQSSGGRDLDSDEEEYSDEEVDQKQGTGPAPSMSNDIMDMFSVSASPPPTPAREGKVVYDDLGLTISSYYRRDEGVALAFFVVTNNSNQLLTQFQVAFDDNIIGAQPLSQPTCNIAPGTTQTLRVPMGIKKMPVDKHSGALLVALRTNLFPMAKFKDTGISAHIFFEEKTSSSTHVSKEDFLSTWASLESNEIRTQISGAPDIEETKRRIAEHNVVYIAHRVVQAQQNRHHIYYSMCLRGFPILAEIILTSAECGLCIRCTNKSLGEVAAHGFKSILA